MLRIYILSVIVGVITGLVTFVFGIGLNLISKFIVFAFPFNIFLLPIVGYLTVKVRQDHNQELNGSMHQIFIATKNDSRLSILIIPFQFVATWFAHLAGASVGREGVAVQLGATIANVTCNLHPGFKRKDITRIGMAAGFAGLFGTPLAATVFCYEVTRKKSLNVKYIVATLIATYSANLTSSLLGLNHFHVNIKFEMLDFREWIFFIFCVIGFAIFGHLFAICLKHGKLIVANIKLNEKTKIVILSIIGGMLLMLIANGRYMSLGTNIINEAFNTPANILVYDSIFKLFFTVYFVSIGFQGGEVTPLFAIGSSLGVCLAYVFALPASIIAAIGYAFTFGNATNAYIASSVLAVEVFGIGVLPYSIVALIVTLFIRNDTHTIYPNLEWE